MYSILETNKNEMVSFDPGKSQTYKALHSPCPLLGFNIHNCTHSQYLLSAQILERNKGRRTDRWVEDHLSLTHSLVFPAIPRIYNQEEYVLL